MRISRALRERVLGVTAHLCDAEAERRKTPQWLRYDANLVAYDLWNPAMSTRSHVATFRPHPTPNKVAKQIAVPYGCPGCMCMPDLPMILQ